MDLLKEQADSRNLIIDNSTLQYKITNSEAQISSDKTNAVVTLNGTLQAATLLNASLSDASKGILGVDDGNGFKYEVDLSSSSIDLATSTGSDGQFTATGKAQLNVSIIKEDLAKTLENKAKKDALAILQQTKGVTYAQIKIFPFWKTTLPKASGIKVLVQD